MKEPAAQSILPAVPNELRPHARKQMNLKTRDFFSGLLERFLWRLTRKSKLRSMHLCEAARFEMGVSHGI